MRVMHVIAPGVLAGAERLVLAGCEALEERGVGVDLVVLEELRVPGFARAFVTEAEARGLNVTALVSQGRLDMTLMRLIATRARRADILHAHGFKALVHVQVARAFCPLVTTWHGDTAFDLHVRCYEQIGHFLANNADKLIVVGRAAYTQALSLGASPQRTVLCENFAPDIESVGPSKRIPRAVPRLLFAGRLSEEKAPLVLLDALAASEVPFHLTFAGEGPLKDVVRARVEELNIATRVRLLGWSSDVGALMDEHDLLVLPSLREGLPLVVLEAAARGMPTVASHVGAVGDVVVNGETGFLVPPGDPHALRIALERAAQSLDSLTQHAQSAAPSMRERFGRARWARETEDIYRELIAAETEPIPDLNAISRLRSLAGLRG